MIEIKPTPKTALFIKGFIAILLLFSLGNSACAQNIPVPENIQAALLSKVLKFNPNFSKSSTVKMLVVYDDDSQINKDKFINGLAKTIEVLAIKPLELEQNISNCNVVYFMSGLYDEAVLSKAHHVLSVTGVGKHVEEGRVSLGFGIENNKPKILINLTSLNQEKQSFVSDVLRIAKIFK